MVKIRKKKKILKMCPYKNFSFKMEGQNAPPKIFHGYVAFTVHITFVCVWRGEGVLGSKYLRNATGYVSSCGYKNRLQLFRSGIKIHLRFRL